MPLCIHVFMEQLLLSFLIIYSKQWQAQDSRGRIRHYDWRRHIPIRYCTKYWPNFADNKDNAYVTYVQCWSSIGPILHDLCIELHLCITNRLQCGAKEILFLQIAYQELTGTFTSMTYCDLLQAVLLNSQMFYCSRPPLVSFSLV